MKTPTQLLCQIIENLKALHEWTEVLDNHFLIKPPSEPHPEFLARHFVELMLELYTRLTGKIAPKGRSGRFVRFVEAAWEELCFLELPDATLATMAKRLPRLTKK